MIIHYDVAIVFFKGENPSYISPICSQSNSNFLCPVLKMVIFKPKIIKVYNDYINTDPHDFA
jgi:hypothetical protein